MPDDAEETVVNTDDTDDEDEVDDAGDDSAEDDEGTDDDADGGSGSADGETAAEVVVKPPTGKDLLELLASDPEAQTLMRSGLEDMIAQRARESAATEESKEFSELIERKDYAAVGERLVERARMSQAREAVTDEVLKEQFAPVYADLFSQPELKSVTAEEREILDPAKFDSDAAYTLALGSFVLGKRHAAAFEAEVTKRVNAKLEADGNVATGAKVTKKSIAGAPAATGPVTGKVSSSDLIKHGLRQIFEPDSIDDDDE